MSEWVPNGSWWWDPIWQFKRIRIGFFSTFHVLIYLKIDVFIFKLFSTLRNIRVLYTYHFCF